MKNYEKELHALATKQNKMKELTERISNTERTEKNSIAAMCEHVKVLEIECAIIKQNAQLSFFNESLPYVLETLKKYNGKSYGKATKEKIRTECIEKYNVSVWLENNGYHASLHIVPLNSEHFTDYRMKTCECSQYKKEEYILTENNKINVLDIPYIMSGYSNKTYIHDTEIAATDIYNTIKKVKAAEKALHDLATELNDILPVNVNNVVTPYMRYPF